MISDRSYMRDPDFRGRGRWSVTAILIVTLIVLFLIQVILEVYAKLDVSRSLALSLDGIKHHRYWQFLTYQFLHSTPWPWHLLGNCLVLYFFGGALEPVLGPRRMLKLYFTGGFLGGALQLLYFLLMQGILPPKEAAFAGAIGTVGASAGISALVAAFCALFPYREAYFVIYFFPVRVQARFVLWFLLGITAFCLLFTMDSVAHAAHMGGLLTGLAYARWFHEGNLIADLWHRFRSRRRSRPIVKVRFPKATSSSAPRNEPVARATSSPDDGDFISKEVDPILDKIRASGIHSLTDRERQTLDDARRKMGRD